MRYGVAMKKPESRFILLFVFIIFGMVVSLQFKSTMNSRKTTAASSLNIEMLREQIAQVSSEIQELRAGIDENIALQNEIIREYISLQDDSLMEEEWEQIKLHTGLVDVSGPGIRITLNDAPERQPDVNLSFLVIHDNDVRTILNDLKIAGAQAIAVNGERIVPMSEQVCAGPTIIINGNRHPVPYIVEAIGDPDVLYESMSNSIKIAEMKHFNIQVEITKVKEIQIPKFSGAGNLDRYISGLEVVEK